MSIGPTIPGIQLFQNLTLKIQGKGHGWGRSWKSQHGFNIQSTHIPFVPCQSGIPFLSYNFFKILPWKSKVKVMEEVTVQSHNLFHVNRPSIPEIQHFKNLTFKIQGQGRITMMSHNYRSRQFHRTSKGVNPSISEIRVLQSLAQVLPHLGKWANNYDTVLLQV